jgi:hypothetical protein
VHIINSLLPLVGVLSRCVGLEVGSPLWSREREHFKSDFFRTERLTGPAASARDTRRELAIADPELTIGPEKPRIDDDRRGPGSRTISAELVARLAVQV